MDPPFSTPSIPRIIPPEHTQTPPSSPSKPRVVDDLLADLSPTNTLEAFTSPSGKLKASIEAATPSERAFALRATVASKTIQEWLDELSAWLWPAEGGSVGFDAPSMNERELSTNLPGKHGGSPTQVQYLGSFPEPQVAEYENRIETICAEMEDMNVEEIKRHVLDTHFSATSRPSSSNSNAQNPNFLSSYTRMDDLTAIITKTVLEAVMNKNILTRLMDMWSTRLVLLRHIPHLMLAFQDAEMALKSGWTAIGKHASVNGDLTTESFEIMRDVLQDKIASLGQIFDFMLDNLEGTKDSLPNSWFDRLEELEKEYAMWDVVATRQIRHNIEMVKKNVVESEDARRAPVQAEGSDRAMLDARIEAQLVKERNTREFNKAQEIARDEAYHRQLAREALTNTDRIQPAAAQEENFDVGYEAARSKSEQEAQDTAKSKAQREEKEYKEKRRLELNALAHQEYVTMQESRAIEILEAEKEADRVLTRECDEETAALFKTHTEAQEASLMASKEAKDGAMRKQKEPEEAQELARLESEEKAKEVSRCKIQKEAEDQARQRAETEANALEAARVQAEKQLHEAAILRVQKELDKAKTVEIARLNAPKEVENAEFAKLQSARGAEESRAAELVKLKTEDARSAELTLVDQREPKSANTDSPDSPESPSQPLPILADLEAEQQNNSPQSSMEPQNGKVVEPTSPPNNDNNSIASIGVGIVAGALLNPLSSPAPVGDVREAKNSCDYPPFDGSNSDVEKSAPGLLEPNAASDIGSASLGIVTSPRISKYAQLDGSSDDSPGLYRYTRHVDNSYRNSDEYRDSRWLLEDEEINPEFNGEEGLPEEGGFDSMSDAEVIKTPNVLPRKEEGTDSTSGLYRDLLREQPFDSMVDALGAYSFANGIDVIKRPVVWQEAESDSEPNIRRPSLSERLQKSVKDMYKAIPRLSTSSKGSGSASADQMQSPSSPAAAQQSPRESGPPTQGPPFTKWGLPSGSRDVILVEGYIRSRPASRDDDSLNVKLNAFPESNNSPSNHTFDSSPGGRDDPYIPTPEIREAEPAEQLKHIEVVVETASSLLEEKDEFHSPVTSNISEPIEGHETPDHSSHPWRLLDKPKHDSPKTKIFVPEESVMQSIEEIQTGDSTCEVCDEFEGVENNNSTSSMSFVPEEIEIQSIEEQTRNSTYEAYSDLVDAESSSNNNTASVPIFYSNTIGQISLPRRQSTSSERTVVTIHQDETQSSTSASPYLDDSNTFSEIEEQSPSAGRVGHRNQNSYGSSYSPSSTTKGKPQPHSLLKSPEFSSSGPSSPTTPVEAPIFDNVNVSTAPILTGPKKLNTNDQIQQQISELLESIPAKIHLQTASKAIPFTSDTLRVQKTRRSVTPGLRSSSSMSNHSTVSRAPTPSFTLAPAYGKSTPRPRYQTSNPDISVYHLSHSNGKPPIKLHVRLVGENGERVMVRVGGGWADLGEYLKEYASHHGHRTSGEGADRVEVQDLTSRVVSNSRKSSAAAIRGNGRASPMPPRPESVMDGDRPRSSLNVRKTRRSAVEPSSEVSAVPGRMSDTRIPSTPLPAVNRQPFDNTPPSANSTGTVASGRSSRMGWDEEDSSLGLAGPKGKKAISERDQEWVDSMKNKVRLASSAEKERSERAERQRGSSFGEMGKVGGTKRLFKKADL